MEWIRQWAGALCCAAVAAGAAGIAAPGGSMNRMFRRVLGVFFLCCVVSPFSGAELREFSFSAEEWMPQQQEITQAVEDRERELFFQTAEEKLARIVSEKLNQMGITGAAVIVYINENKTEILPEDIVLEAVLPQEYEPMHEEICRRLEYELGITVRVGYA